MKAALSIDIPDAPAAPHSRADALHLVATDSALVLLRQVLAQVTELKQKLASSQQELSAMQQQLEFLTKANTQLKELAVRHESVGSPSSSSPGKLTDTWLSGGLDPNAMTRLDRLLTTRIRFRSGDQLYRAGDAFTALYMIRLGSCKTLLLTRDGQDQVVGYHIAGDIIGMDGIGGDMHRCQAVALESLEVCVLPFDQLEAFARVSGPFQHNLHKALSDESGRAQDQLTLLGTMHADQRVAAFLLELSQRYQARGYSSCEFVLRMTRVEIGSYLGLKLETVSRTFSRFQRERLVQVEGRSVKLLDRVALRRLVDGSA